MGMKIHGGVDSSEAAARDAGCHGATATRAGMRARNSARAPTTGFQPADSGSGNAGKCIGQEGEVSGIMIVRIRSKSSGP
jgi:hypothetical protein